MRHFRLLSLLLPVLFALTACDTIDSIFGSEEKKLPGERVAVLREVPPIKADETLAADALEIPEAVVNSAWPNVGGGEGNAPGALALAAKAEKVWSSSIGSGSEKTRQLTTRPVAADGMVFTIDTDSELRAFALNNGDMVWRQDLVPEDNSSDSFGGGVAVAGGRLFVATGFGEILAIEAKTGTVQWRQKIPDAFRNAPIVAGDLVVAVSVNNRTYALNMADGALRWQHSGINEVTSLLGGASPVATEDTIYVTYSSGEVFALRRANGNVIWGDSLLTSGATSSALPGMADIKGQPVLARGRLFIASHGGQVAAYDVRTARRVFDLEIASINTPYLAGRVLFVLGTDNQLLATDGGTGRVFWAKQLDSFENMEKQRRPILYTGPVLAGGHLWLGNSSAQILALNPKNGETEFMLDAADKVFIPPIVVDNTLLFLTDDGTLAAYR